MFEYTLKLLNSKIHPVPENERLLVEAILKNRKGYLTKNEPKKVIFYADIARQIAKKDP